MNSRQRQNDEERAYRDQLKDKIEKHEQMRKAKDDKRGEDRGICIREDVTKAKAGVSPNVDVAGARAKPSGSLTSGSSSFSSSGQSSSSSTQDMSAGSLIGEEGRTMSALFREKYGANATDRVYGLTTESLDYLKAHPDLVIPGPNPQRITHDELQNVLNGFENMYLAHEIAVNEDFRLERFVPEQDSLEARVQAQMKRAFWDIFEENLIKEPPVYNQALAVLEELKKSLLSLLLPHNTQMRKRIHDTLDIALIKRQVEQDCFDVEEFRTFSRFVVDTLSQLCCPLRDEEIESLRSLQGVTAVFRGIMEMMDKMKLDMANFFIQQFRSSVVRHCVQYERIKFADFIELEYFLKEDGLRLTKNWLMRHKIGNRDGVTIIAKAFGELLSYETKTDVEWPETLTLDVIRFASIANQVKRLSIIGACLLTTGSMFQIIYGTVQPDFRDLFKKQLKILITDDDAKDPVKLLESMERAGEQAIFLINEFVKKTFDRRVSDFEKSSIRNCIADVALHRDHKIRCLLLRRIIDYAEETCMAQIGHHVSMPAGLSSIQYEVAYTVGQFQRIVRHNRGVYGELYQDILNKWNHPPQYIDDSHPNGDQEFRRLLNSLKRPFLDIPIHAQLKVEKKRKKEELARLTAERAVKAAELAARQRRMIEDGFDPVEVYGPGGVPGTVPVKGVSRKGGSSKTSSKAGPSKFGLVKGKEKNPKSNKLTVVGKGKTKTVGDKYAKLEDVPLGAPCYPDCREGTACSSATEDTATCSTALTVVPEPDQETFVNKLPEDMTTMEMLGYYDQTQFTSFCCDGEIRRNRMIGKPNLPRKRKIRHFCAPVKPDEPQAADEDEDAEDEFTTEDDDDEADLVNEKIDKEVDDSAAVAGMAALALTTESTDDQGVEPYDENTLGFGSEEAQLAEAGEEQEVQEPENSEPNGFDVNNTDKPN